jgi:20S proteasome alpha/beta subunit
MTTVAYRAGILACDSQATSGHLKTGTFMKIGKVGRVLYGGCGNASMVREFNAWIANGLQGEMPKLEFDEDDGMAGLVVYENKRFLSFERTGIVALNAEYMAMGSGRELALGAMAMGATAIQAVQAAMQHDIYSGGPIQSVSLHPKQNFKTICASFPSDLGHE